MAGQTALVVSAHAADFVWRAGGAIALHAAKGYAVTIVCLSFGERGESATLWKDPGATLQGVKDARRKESEDAATALVAHDIAFFAPRHYPLAVSAEATDRLARGRRTVTPACHHHTPKGEHT